ncbi:MAG: anthranilate phosphoribosyltransferase [Chloroflexi bacterium]|nr:anthranilate phosphoribosyltransferase [Chloroflexota bacterium]
MTQYAKDRPRDDTPFERMRFYLREIGQGPKNCRDLTREEARDAMELVLAQQATRAQMGAFLLLERFKGESPEELLGFADAVRGQSVRIRPKAEGLLDIGSPYDGRKRSIVVSPASSIVTAAAGVPVVMHGERDLGPKHGVPIGDVLEALGIDTDAPPEEVQASIDEVGLGYMHQARFVPSLFALKDLREEIALRSCIHTIEKVYNLAGASYSIIGLTHLPYMEKMLAAAQEMGFRRIMIVQGIEGNEDAPTSRSCRALLWEGGEVEELRIDPQEYDLQPASQEEMAGGDASYNAAIALRILEGEPGPYRDLVLLNAGIRVFLTERAASIEKGIALAREAIESGAARARLEALRARAAARSPA